MFAELAGQQQSVQGMLMCCLGFGNIVCSEWPINPNMHAGDEPEKNVNPD